MEEEKKFHEKFLPQQIRPRKGLFWFVLDCPSLRLGDDSRAVLYIAATPVHDDNHPYTGSDLYESDDNLEFHKVGGKLSPNTLGKTMTVLPPASLVDAPETGYSVDIELCKHGVLQSYTLTQVQDFGYNMALIGNEFFHFTDVTVLGERQWRLHGDFIRGARNTFMYSSGHVVGERFILIDNTIGAYYHMIDMRGKTRYYKVVASNRNHSRVDSVAVTHEHNTFRPFTPGLFEGVYGSKDLTLSWQHRSRKCVGGTHAVGDPLIDESLRVSKLELLDSNSNVVLTQIIEGSDWTYSPKGSQPKTNQPLTFRLYAMNNNRTYQSEPITKRFEDA